MDRAIYLEADLREDTGDAADWTVHVCIGRTLIYLHDADRSGTHRQTVDSRAGTWPEKQLDVRKGRARPVDPPTRLDLMAETTEAIGQCSDFVCLETFVRCGEAYLGEIGLVPNGCAKCTHDPKLDWMLGGAWQVPLPGRVHAGLAFGHYARKRPFSE